MSAKKKTDTAVAETPVPVQANKVPDGSYFTLRKKDAFEAVLTEIQVKDGAVVGTKTMEDTSRILLAKLNAKIADGFHG